MPRNRTRKARSPNTVRSERNSTPNPFLQSKSANSLAYAVALLLFVAAYYRIHYGIDFSDEGQALGWLYGPMIGYTPFVNDLFFQQTGSLLFTPLFYLWHKLMGNEGVALFCRHVLMLLSLGASFCVYTFSKKFLSAPLATLVAAATYGYLPFSFPLLYYNNIAYLCFLSALFFGATALMESSKKKFFWTGILFGLGVFSYPPLIVAVVAFSIGTYVYLKGKDIPPTPLLANLVLGGCIPGILGGLLLLSFGIENLINSIEFSKHFNALGGWEKIGFIFQSYFQWFPEPWKLIALAILGLIGHASRGFSFLWVLVLFPIIIVTDSNGSAYFPKSHYLTIFYLSAVAPFLLWLSLKKKIHLELALIISVSLVGGLSMAWSSGNGLPNAGIGFYPGVVASIIFFALWIHNEKTNFQFGGQQAGLFIFLLCVSVGGSVMYSSYAFIYRDDSFPELDTRVTSGPFAGIMTTGQRTRFIGEVQEDVDEFSKGRESVLFFDHFPAGYLFSELKPMTRALFMHPYHPTRKFFMEFYSHEENLPDVIFEFYGFRFGKEQYVVFNRPDDPPSGRDPFRGFFAKLVQRHDYEIVKQRQLYRVWTRREAVNNPS